MSIFWLLILTAIFTLLICKFRKISVNRDNLYDITLTAIFTMVTLLLLTALTESSKSGYKSTTVKHTESIETTASHDIGATPNRTKTKYQYTKNGLAYRFINKNKLKYDLNNLVGFSQSIDDIKTVYQHAQQNEDSDAYHTKAFLIYGPNYNHKGMLALAFAKSFKGDAIMIRGQNFNNWELGKARVQDLFSLALTTEPAVIIIDRIDILLGLQKNEHLGDQMGFYNFIDGLDALYNMKNNVVIIGLTQDINSISPQILDKNRFGDWIEVSLPNDKDRKDMLTQGFEQFSDTTYNIDLMVEKTSGLTRGELFQVVNQALLEAELNNEKTPSQAHVEIALERITKHKVSRNNMAKIDTSLDIIPANEIKMNFKDIIGQEQVKTELKQMIAYANNDSKLAQAGISLPRGVLMHGPPGTGKTYLAKALAGESNMNFISVSGSAFVQEFVGIGSKRVRELFKIARANKPCIIFIDEIDALAPSRSDMGNSGNKEYNQTVNQLLFELDSINDENNHGIIIMGATNRMAQIDEAVLRPGRLDKKIHVGLPSLQDREQILRHYFDKIGVKYNINLKQLAEETSGVSPAELRKITQESFLKMLQEQKEEIDSDHVIFAKRQLFTEKANYSQERSKLDLQIIRPMQITTSLNDIAGLEEVKQEIKDVLDSFENPEKYQKMGATTPRGVVFYGPPGTGKTMLARGIAGESKATFISVSGSAFIQEYVGVGASRIRELFEVARQYAPSIIFIDEIDALAPSRMLQNVGSENRQTVNQLLTELDNLDSNKNNGIMIIGATNQLPLLDNALLRPGRFDKKIYIRKPNLAERKAILAHYAKKTKLDKSVNLGDVAAATPGLSGAELKAVMNDASIHAIKANRSSVSNQDINAAIDNILLGLEVKTASILKSERENTAYHEAGHALVGLLSKNYPASIYKVTVGMRDSTLGITHFKEDHERYSQTYAMYLDQIATALGGRIAEEMVYGKNGVTGGAANDLKEATNIAKFMVMQLGFGNNINNKAYGHFVGNHEDANKQITEILDEAEQNARNILQKNQDKLHKLAKELLKKEILTLPEIKKLLRLD